MISTLNRLPNGNIELTITIPWKRVKSGYEKVLEKFVKQTEIKGFRKGKAPKKLVEEKVGKETLYEETLKDLIPQVYLEAIQEYKLQPVVNPQLKLTSASWGKDWQIVATTCEIPEVKLGDYKGEIKKALAVEKIWVPGKDKKEKKPTTEDKLGKIFKTLLETCQIRVPEILIEDEVNRMLSRLIDQTARLGLTVEEYLTSQKKTAEELRKEYHQQAEETLKLEFILSAIADEQKIQVSDEEVEKMIQALPDEETKKEFQNPEQKLYLRHLLRKRQVIDSLSSL
jgi:FKBP-type peptidyl-prolyl cis-trans isomerase (trigger factor)